MYLSIYQSIYEILQNAYRHTLRSQHIIAVLPLPPRLALLNAKTLLD